LPVSSIFNFQFSIFNSKRAIVKQKPPIDNHLLRYKFPPVKQKKLSNGLTLLVIERRELPGVYFRLGIGVGEKHDPPEMKGAVEMVSQLLKKGAGARSYREIADAIDFVGGSLECSASADFFYLHGSFLKEYLQVGLELAGDMVIHPAFSPEELEKERAKILADLENEKSSPAFLAQRQMDVALYRPHPYSGHKTAESISKITRETLADLHRRYFSPAAACLAVAGDISFSEAAEQAERYFSAWQSRKSSPGEFSAPSNPASRVIYLVDRPGSEQVNITLGNRLFPTSHPDYEKAVVANKILGGGASGRLFLSLREQKGYTYGAGSSLDLFKETGGWIASAEVRPEVTDKALEGFFEEFEKLASEPAPETELQNAKRYLIGVFPLRNETPASIASLALRQKLYGLPKDYWDQYLVKIDAVSAEDVQTLARNYLRREQLAIVLVGDARQIAPKLKPFREVEILDLEGKRI